MGELHLPRLRGAVGFIADTSWREHRIVMLHKCQHTVFFANYRKQRSCWAAWEDKKYHLDENGFVQKGCWFEDESGRYFLATKDGHALREDVTIQAAEYYFDENAVMQTGLVTRPDGNTYYYDETGALQKNITVNIDGVEYTVDKKGIATQN